jgi:hypothetical protein
MIAGGVVFYIGARRIVSLSFAMSGPSRYNKKQFDINRLLQAQHNLTQLAEDYIETSNTARIASADIVDLLQVEEVP